MGTAVKVARRHRVDLFVAADGRRSECVERYDSDGWVCGRCYQGRIEEGGRSCPVCGAGVLVVRHRASWPTDTAERVTERLVHWLTMVILAILLVAVGGPLAVLVGHALSGWSWAF